MIAKAQWAHLIPHADAMCLLDAVVTWDTLTLHATAISHRDPSNPLRSDDRLRAVHLCEYGAQAMALHGGLLAQREQQKAPPGFLVSLRGVELHVARVDDLSGALDVHVTQLHGDDNGWQYEFRIAHAGDVIALGRAAVLHRR